MMETLWDLASAGGEFFHDRFVQPGIHAGRILGITGVTELLSQGRPILETGIEIGELHQIQWSSAN